MVGQADEACQGREMPRSITQKSVAERPQMNTVKYLPNCLRIFRSVLHSCELWPIEGSGAVGVLSILAMLEYR